MTLRMVVVLVVVTLVASCARPPAAPQTLQQFPIDGSEKVLTQSAVTFDRESSADGNGSLKLEATQPMTFRLFEVKNPDIENARLIYKAKLKAANVTGKAYLEMWCVFPGQGEFFSRSLQSPVTGTVDWSSTETPFFLQKGQKPELVKLNVVVDGAGTVWIDDIALAKGPLGG